MEKQNGKEEKNREARPSKSPPAAQAYYDINVTSSMAGAAAAATTSLATNQRVRGRAAGRAGRTSLLLP